MSQPMNNNFSHSLFLYYRSKIQFKFFVPLLKYLLFALSCWAIDNNSFSTNYGLVLSLFKNNTSFAVFSSLICSNIFSSIVVLMANLTFHFVEAATSSGQSTSFLPIISQGSWPCKYDFIYITIVDLLYAFNNSKIIHGRCRSLNNLKPSLNRC